MSSVNEVLSLSGVSDEELVGGLKRLVLKEQKCLHRIIVHLAEVERRRLFAELGYSSMFDYVTRGLGYSNASAQRRICAARAVKAVPEVYGLLEQGRISFKVLEVAGEALSKPNGKELLLELCGRTKDEALRIVARYFPVEPKRLFDSIVPVVAKNSVAVGNPVSDLPLFADKNSNYFRAEVNGNLVAESAELFRMTVTVSAEFQEKLERVKELMFSGFGETGEVLERALDEFIKRHAPEEKIKRREKREAKKLREKSEKSETLAGELSGAAETILAALPAKDRDLGLRRYVTGPLRDEILERDGHACTYVSPEGVKCGSKVGLQIDHITPWACGGRTEAGNLRTVCQAHNLMFARKVFGDRVVDEAIAARKPDKCGIPLPNNNRERFADEAEWFMFG